MVRICALSLCLLLVGCAARNAPPPGHDGPVPSVEGQAVLGELRGKTVEHRGVNVVIRGFAVVPNPVSRGGKGPVVLIDRGGEQDYLPALTDGDIADLYHRTTGERHASLTGTQSEDYRSAWKR